MSADDTPDAGQGPGQAQGRGTTTTDAAHHPRENKDQRKARRWAETKMDLKWATALLFALILAVAGWSWGSWKRSSAGEEDMPKLATEIFAQDGLVVPFEVLSILLLAALIAGIVIAIREPEGGA